jgi:hypothetical protein
MTDTLTLWRPVGQREPDLVAETGRTRFPPRLTGKPIFYPALNEAYATKIARDCNTKDPACGHVGHVLRFDVDAEYAKRFPSQHVVGAGIIVTYEILELAADPGLVVPARSSERARGTRARMHTPGHGREHSDEARRTVRVRRSVGQRAGDAEALAVKGLAQGERAASDERTATTIPAWEQPPRDIPPRCDDAHPSTDRRELKPVAVATERSEGASSGRPRHCHVSLND